MLDDLKKALGQLLQATETKVDDLAHRVRERYNLYGQLQIVPFAGYANGQHAWVRGRVLQAKPLSSTQAHDSLWENLLNMYKRMESDEVPRAPVQVSLGGQTWQTTTDEEGYFHLELRLSQPPAYLPQVQWVDYEMIDPITSQPIKTQGPLYSPHGQAGYGVISDVDDTIVVTAATDPLEMLKNTFLKNAATRLAFPGVAALYQALAQGHGQPGSHPLFYVSSSPWNLYDFLTEFLRLNQIPAGPLLLRDYGLAPNKLLAGSHSEHKLGHIRQILLAYPHLRFLLIGDSGQEDAPIYGRLAREFPARVAAIYIRDVGVPARRAWVQQVFASYNEVPVPMLLVEHSLTVAEHAAAQGWLPASAVAQVKQAGS
ncbi:MAG: DUF2183 domain-containing protein [Bernardetiaceae bacterium]|jgi:phosphatidate phosphatase APP1|nr:DUF2183 domain-containing protein [Bernardetiaceae bacterium]